MVTPSGQTLRRRIAPLLACALVLLGVAVPALAATTTGIGTFTPLAGTSTSYTSTMQLPATGFPSASMTSTSRSGQVGVQTGATNWFGASTPVGLKYGSSENQPYLNLRPKVDNATGASITSYTFQRATPTGWAFVLGDVDADAVTISATKADGTAATAAEIDFQSVFNLCDATPKPSACSGVVAPFDLPTWNAGTLTLTGNVGAIDTTGAAGWFEPTVPLKTLSFSFVRRAGFPVYQTWFAIKKQDVRGTVSANGSCVQTGTDVRLIDASGAVVANTETVADGTYTFAGVAASDGYQVEISGLPAGCVADGPIRASIDLRSGDDTADFAIRGVVPLPISGVVKDENGNPLAGVIVSIDGPSRQTTTDSNGYYIFDVNPPATYTLTVIPPSGYTTTTSPDPVVVVLGDPVPKTGNDFVLTGLPSISGTVSNSEGGVGGVTVVLKHPGDPDQATVTDSAGKYTFPRLAGSGYTVTIPTPPSPYLPVPDQSGKTPGDTANFGLERPGAIAGAVTKAGVPVAGAVIMITGPSSFSQQLTTDAEGNYAIGGLAPGAYAVTLTPPSGTTVAGPSVTVVIPAVGADFGAVDFAIVDTVAPVPMDPGSPGGSGGSSDDSDPLPDTGGPSELIGVLGLGLLLTGSALVLATRRIRMG